MRGISLTGDHVAMNINRRFSGRIRKGGRHEKKGTNLGGVAAMVMIRVLTMAGYAWGTVMVWTDQWSALPGRRSTRGTSKSGPFPGLGWTRRLRSGKGVRPRCGRAKQGGEGEGAGGHVTSSKPSCGSTGPGRGRRTPGLSPPGGNWAPPYRRRDKALETGNPQELLKLSTRRATTGSTSTSWEAREKTPTPRRVEAGRAT